MGKTGFAGLIVAMALAGCDDGTPAANVTSIKVGENSAYQQRLVSMDPRLRNATFMRAIRDSGKSCDRVSESFHQGVYQDLPMWTARCERSEWAIFIAADGGVQVRDCAQMQQLGLPMCEFAAADDQSNASSSSVKE
jgi:hypothetical protein